jgi:hypothetical protein
VRGAGDCTPIAVPAGGIWDGRDRFGGAAGTPRRPTLTHPYNGRPARPDNADRRFDAAVSAAYGWPPDLADDDLPALNLERAGRTG